MLIRECSSDSGVGPCAPKRHARERLNEQNTAEGPEEENRVLRLEAQRAPLKSEREDALAARKPAQDGAGRLRPVPSMQRVARGTRVDGICESCEIDKEIDVALVRNTEIVTMPTSGPDKRKHLELIQAS